MDKVKIVKKKYYVEYGNISNTTWNRVHLICKFFDKTIVTKIIFQKAAFQVFNMSDRCYFIVLMPDSYWPICHPKPIDYSHESITIYISNTNISSIYIDFHLFKFYSYMVNQYIEVLYFLISFCHSIPLSHFFF